MRSRRWWLFILALSALPALAGSAPYGIVDLGIPSNELGFLGSINNAGQVVGSMRAGRGPVVSHAFLWLPESALGLPAGAHDLGTLSDSTLGSAAFDVNDDLTIAGWSESAELVFPGLHALESTIWAHGLMAPLGRPDPEKYPFAVGWAINNHGMVVGEDGTGFSCRPVVWRPKAEGSFAAGPAVLEPPAGPSRGSARDVNDLGQVVGQLTFSCDTFGSTAFLWLPEPAYGLPAGFQELTPGLDPQEDAASANAINEQGMVAGRILNLDTGGLAFVWQAGVLTILPTDPSASTAEATGVNEAGQVVGHWRIGLSEYHAFVWQNGVLQELEDLLPPDSDWVLQTVVDVNDQGQILGFGRLGGEFRAFVMTPGP